MSNQISLLGKQRFLPLFVTQFLGAFNDNIYKNAIIMLIVFKLAAENSAIWVNAAAGLFILPFFIFSAFAGQLAEKYEKSQLLRWCKLAEIPIMTLGTFGFYMQSPEVLVGTLFLMGTQSTFFGPAKYSIIPQHLKEEELTGGNGLVEMGTFLAILLGTMAGAYLINLTDGEVIVSSVILGVAAIGYFVSRCIPEAPANKPDLAINLNPLTETVNLYRLLKGTRKSVFLSVIGLSWFWFLGATYLTQIPEFTKLIYGNEEVVTALLVCFSVGIALGSLLCESLSRNRIELGIVPLGSIGMTAFGIVLYFAASSFAGDIMLKEGSVLPLFGLEVFLVSIDGIMIFIAVSMIGVFGGFYTVPLYALIQKRTPSDKRSRVVASNNMLNALFMVVSAIIAMIVLGGGLTVFELFLGLAIVNAIVAVYIYRRVPEFFIRFVVWMLTHTIYRVRHSNIDNLPEEGGCVIVSNHISYMDALLIGGAFKRPVRYVMFEPIFRIPVLNMFFKAVGAIPIDSQKRNPEVYENAFRKIKEYLDNGEVVCIFPEGKLTLDGEIDGFRPGIEKIIAQTPVPVLPVALQGFWGSMFSKARKIPFPRLRWSKINLHVGEIISPELVTKEVLFEKVSSLRGEVK